MRRFFRFNSLLNAAILVGIGGLLSRLLGLLRDRLLAGSFGASRELDIYYAAFRLPDFIYNLLIGGAIAAAFIPLFTSLKEEKKRSEFASSALNVIIVIIGALSLFLFLFAPLLIRLMVPGFDGEARSSTILLTRIMLFQPLILAASSIVTSILQGSKKFLWASFAPSFYNIGIIIGITAFTPIFGIKGLAYGVILGSLLHFGVQIPSLVHTGFIWRPIFTISAEIKKMFLLMGPRVFGIASDQINLVVTTAIASTLSLGSIAIFSLAQNIQGAPVGIIGIAIATAVFPTLSLAYNGEKAKEEFAKTFFEAFRLVLFFSIPLSILFILLRAQIVRVILGAGLFNWEHTRLAAAVLGIFGLSVFAQSLTPLLTRAFYSMRDTKTPVMVGIVSVVINIGLALGFIPLLNPTTSFHHAISQALKINDIPDIHIIALPLAFSLTVIFQFILLFFLLFGRIDGSTLAAMNTTWLKLVAATGIMAIITYFSLRPFAQLFDMTTGIGILAQGLGAGIVGISAYFLLTALLKENPFIKNVK